MSWHYYTSVQSLSENETDGLLNITLISTCLSNTYTLCLSTQHDRIYPLYCTLYCMTFPYSSLILYSMTFLYSSLTFYKYNVSITNFVFHDIPVFITYFVFHDIPVFITLYFVHHGTEVHGTEDNAGVTRGYHIIDRICKEPIYVFPESWNKSCT